MSWTKPAPKLNYYDRTDLQKQLAAQAEQMENRRGASAFLRGESRTDYLARIAAEKPAEARKIYLQDTTVAREAAAEIAGIARASYNKLVAHLPRQVRLAAPKEQEQAKTLADFPHLAYAVVGYQTVAKPNGEKSILAIYSANFKAEVLPDEKGGLRFRNIPAQRDGVKNEPMYYAHARKLGPDGKPGALDPDFAPHGIAYRMDNLGTVARACCRVAGVDPEAKRQAVARPVPGTEAQARRMAFA